MANPVSKVGGLKAPTRGQLNDIRELQMNDRALEDFDEVFDDMKDDHDLLLNDLEDQDLPGE